MQKDKYLTIEIAEDWQDYELLDSGNGRRLERFGRYVLNRPDPQTIWLPKLDVREWQKADAVFDPENNGGKWSKNTLPEKWEVRYNDLKFYAKLSPFKHTGVFPEQAVQWDFIQDAIRNANRPIKIFNLFAYTGIASLAAASAGAEVTHVDASSQAIGWAKENQAVSGLTEKPIRWILDDVMKFVEKEIRRGHTYDGIIMDPPIYGHGVKNEVWDFMKDFSGLIQGCATLLSPSPLFVIVNAYAISASSLMLENVLADYLPQGTVTTGELILKETSGNRLLSTGIFSRWTK